MGKKFSATRTGGVGRVYLGSGCRVVADFVSLFIYMFSGELPNEKCPNVSKAEKNSK